MKQIRACLLAVLLLSQSFHLQAASRFWVGVLPGNWSSTLNWSSSSGGLGGSSVPASADNVFFDGGSLGLDIGKCTVDATVNVTSITISSGYSGTLVQGANSVTVSGAAAFGGGTFTGGTANITISGAFSLSATTFTSTSAIMELRGNAAFTGGSFAHNNGTVRFNGSAAATLSGTSPVFYALEFAGTGHTYTVSSTGHVGVANALNITGASSCVLNTGAFDVSGNINLTNTSTGDGGTATINITGISNQTIASSLPINQGTLPAVTISKTGGTLTLPALITVNGNWTYTSGTIDAATNNATVVYAGTLNITGSHTLDNINFEGNNNWTYTIDPATTLTANGDVSITGSSNLVFATGTINLNGNLNLTNTATGDGGTAVLAFTGSGNQAINSVMPVNESSLPAVNIAKTAGVLTLPTLLTVRGNWTYTSGMLDISTNSSTVVFASALSTGALGITGSHTLNNVILEGNNNNTVTVNTGTVLTVIGTLSTTGTANVFLNTTVTGATAIQAQGDITINNTSSTGGGTGLILINGSGAQAFTGNATSGNGLLPYITIQKTSGTLSLSGTVSVIRDWTFTSGTVNPGSSTIVFGGNSLNVKGAGMNFYNANFVANTITLGSNLSANNNLTISGTAIVLGGSRSISLAGNWSDYGTAGFTEGTSTVNFNGSSLQTITSPGGENFNNLTVTNSGGGVQLVNNVGIAATLSMAQGNIDLNGATLTLGTSLAAPGTLSYTSGTMINTGSFVRWVATAAISASAGLFPMGTPTDYRPITVTSSTSPTTGGTITASYTNATTNTAVSIADGASTVVVRKDLHWDLATGATLAGGVYNLAISGTGFGAIGSVSDLRLTLVNSITGTAGVNGGTTTNPQVTRSSLSFANLSNSFYLGSINSLITPLPIGFLSFTGSVGNGQVVLDWTAGSFGGNTFYTVQRSKDAASWQEIARVPAGVGNDVTASYSETDKSPYDGQSYYRIVETGDAGNLIYSAILSMATATPTSSISLYPNPAKDHVTIVFPATANYEVVLMNSAGRIMHSPAISTGDPLTIPVAGVAPGVYFVRIRYLDKAEIKKVLIGK